ncbi:MAG TPA: hypothetical protein VJ483_06300 [Holophagaceae bacterium]|nr:hypothetical protein [Holophagaceae bacterium]
MAMLGLQPLRADGFTDRVKSAFQKNAPDLRLRVESQDEIVLKGPGADVTASIEKLRGACASDPDGCEDRIQAFVAKVVAATRATGQVPFEAAKVLPVLREAGILRDPTLSADGAVDGPVVHRALPGGLIEAFVVNAPPVQRYVKAGDLKGSRLELASLHKTASANAAAIARPTAQPVEGVPGLFSILGGNGLGTCLVFDPQCWKDLEKAAGGPVAVICPAYDWILAARQDDPAALKQLRAFSAYVARREAYPLPAVALVRHGGELRELSP